MTFGLFGSSENSAPRLCRINPYPGTVTPDPHPAKLLLTQETMFPSSSAADNTIVSPLESAVDVGPVAEACSGSTLPHNDSAWAFDTSMSIGTFTKLGSAL